MKHLARLSFLLIFILTLLALPTSAYAQTPNGDGKVVVGGSYRLSSGQTLNGSLLVIGGEATLEAGSRIAGDVALLGGTLSIQGEVDGNLAVLGGSVLLDDTAVITGDVTTIGGTVHRSEKARIEGNVSEGPRNFSLPMLHNISNIINPVGRFVSGLLSSIILAAIAVLAVLFLPRPTERVAATITGQTLVSGAMGLLTLFLYPALLLILTVTIILIPVALLGILLFIAAVLFGWIALGMEIGRRLAVALKVDWAPPLAAGLGTLLLTLVASFAGIIPCLDVIIGLLVTMFGLGGVIMSRFGTVVYTPYTVPTAANITPMSPVPPSAPYSSSPVVMPPAPTQPQQPPVNPQDRQIP